MVSQRNFRAKVYCKPTKICLLKCSYFLLHSRMADSLLALLIESMFVTSIFSNSVVFLINNPRLKQVLPVYIFFCISMYNTLVKICFSSILRVDNPYLIFLYLFYIYPVSSTNLLNLSIMFLWLMTQLLCPS